MLKVVVALICVLCGLFTNIDSNGSTYLTKQHPFLQKIKLSKEMLDLLGLTERDKRQYGPLDPPDPKLLNTVGNFLNTAITDNAPPASTPLYELLSQVENVLKSIPTQTPSALMNITVNPVKAAENLDDLVNMAAQSVIKTVDFETGATKMATRSLNMSVLPDDYMQFLQNPSIKSSENPFLVAFSKENVLVNDTLSDTPSTPYVTLKLTTNVVDVSKTTQATPTTPLQNPPSKQASIIKTFVSQSARVVKPTKSIKVAAKKRMDEASENVCVSTSAPTTIQVPTEPGAPDKNNATCVKFDQPQAVVDTLKNIKMGIEELITGKFGGRKEGLPCDIMGNWVSDAGGVVIQITRGGCSGVNVNLVNAVNRSCAAFMSAAWKANIIVPYDRISLLVLNAIYEEQLQMASFSGECRICGGKESIMGHWLLVTDETECENLNKAQISFGDIWRRQ